MSRGSRPGERRGGRKPGIPNKASLARAARISETGPAPLDVMIEAMRFLRGLAAQERALGEKADMRKVRGYLLDAAGIAKDAAQYVHPKFATVTLAGDDAKPIRARVEVEFV